MNIVCSCLYRFSIVCTSTKSEIEIFESLWNNKFRQFLQYCEAANVIRKSIISTRLYRLFSNRLYLNKTKNRDIWKYVKQEILQCLQYHEAANAIPKNIVYVCIPLLLSFVLQPNRKSKHLKIRNIKNFAHVCNIAKKPMSLEKILFVTVCTSFRIVCISANQKLCKLKWI